MFNIAEREISMEHCKKQTHRRNGEAEGEHMWLESVCICVPSFFFCIYAFSHLPYKS